jgi:hypothetical protein
MLTSFQVDNSPSNPFLSNDITEQEAPRVSKRRKVSNHHRKDPQVEEALRKDDGMVYVL